MTITDDPLDGLEWNEAEHDPSFYRGLILIIAFDEDKKAEIIGTGFIIKSIGRKAWAVTAAHVLDQTRRLYDDPPRHNRTSLSMFLPKSKPFKVDQRKVRAFINTKSGPQILSVTSVAFNSKRDIGIFTVQPQAELSVDIPFDEFLIDERVPNIGSLVSVLTFANLSVENVASKDTDPEFTLSMRPIVRTGRVTAYYPDGNRLCKGPCIETSIPIYSGMSGGLVFAYNDFVDFNPFAVVCSDPDPDGDEKMDRTKAGASIMALLGAKVIRLPQETQIVKFELNETEFGGEFDPATIQPSYRPVGFGPLAEYAWWHINITSYHVTLLNYNS